MTDTKNKVGNRSERKACNQGIASRYGGLKVPVNLSRAYQNYFLDLTVLITAVLCTITGLIKWPGLVYTLGLSYQSLPMEALTLIHDWTGLLMVAIISLHILMHGKWMAVMTGKILHLNGGKNE